MLVASVLLAGSPGAQASDPATSGAGPRPHHVTSQLVEISVLPGISQFGASPAPSREALTVVSVRPSPVSPRRLVSLARRAGGGGWKAVASTRVDSDGLAEFSVPTLLRGRPVAYRAIALPFRGLPARRSAPVSTAWGAADFVDEFSGTALSTRWDHRIQFHNPWGGRACSKGSPLATAVLDGTLRLGVLADPTATGLCSAYDGDGHPLGQFRYRLNGHVSTQYSFDFLYGVAAARMRFQRRQGQHAALWLQPRGLLTTGPTPWGAEIDAIEWYGQPGRGDALSSSVHAAPDQDGVYESVGGRLRDSHRFLAERRDRWWRNYHVFSVEWTPAEYVFRIDGHETWRTDQLVSHDPEFVILSLLSSDYELGRLGGDEHLPQYTRVDWVKVWRADAPDG